MMSEKRENILYFFNELFLVSLLTYFLLLLLDVMFTGFVSFFLHDRFVLFLALVSGCIAGFFPAPVHDTPRPASYRRVLVMSIVASIVGLNFFLVLTRTLGWVGLPVSIVVGALLGLVFWEGAREGRISGKSSLRRER